MEHSASIAIEAWVKKYAKYIPVELLHKILRDNKIADKKASVIPVLTSVLSEHPELLNELHGAVATSMARASAEGKVAAGSILNRHRGARVPDLHDQHNKELTAIQKSGSYRKDLDPTTSLLIAGLAGDLALSIPGQKYDDSTDTQVQSAITNTIAAGAGAVFYMGMATHASYADAQLTHLTDAGEKVDFITSGDGRVCSACLSAEDGNPYNPDEVPPIPFHGGCRCWYAASGAIT